VRGKYHFLTMRSAGRSDPLDPNLAHEPRPHVTIGAADQTAYAHKFRITGGSVPSGLKDLAVDQGRLGCWRLRKDLLRLTPSATMTQGQRWLKQLREKCDLPQFGRVGEHSPERFAGERRR
jgi:hypothetical protein